MKMQIGVGTISLILTAALMPNAAEALSTTVNCPAQSIAAAVNAGFDEIAIVGTCTEDVGIQQDDVTLQGGTVIGEITVNGARRVTIQDMTIRGDGTPGKNGIVVINGAAVTLSAVTVDGATTGIVINQGSSEIVDSTIKNNTSSGIDFDEGGYGLVSNSTIQNNTDLGVHIGHSSSGNHILGNPLGVSVDFSGSTTFPEFSPGVCLVGAAARFLAMDLRDRLCPPTVLTM